jgi:hypothetical protein
MLRGYSEQYPPADVDGLQAGLQDHLAHPLQSQGVQDPHRDRVFSPFRLFVPMLTRSLWQMDDPQSILSLEVRKYQKGAVSWTHEAGKYYLHTCDREELYTFARKFGW